MSDRTVAIVQARMTSTRLPGKITMPLAGVPMLLRVVERVRNIQGIDLVCIAIPEGAAHDPIATMFAKRPEIALTRGPEHDVLRRYSLAAKATGATRVVRITSDCPLIDPAVSSAAIMLANSTGHTLARTSFDSGYPLGFDTEVMSATALSDADREASDPYEREHVTPFLWRRPDRYPAVFLDRRPDRRHWRLTVDTPDDYAVVAELYRRLHPLDPLFGMAEIEPLLLAEPAILATRASSA